MHDVSQGEYDVAPCVAHSTVGSCVDKVATQMTFPLEGEMVFAEGHLHYGGIGINVVREVSPHAATTLLVTSTPHSNHAPLFLLPYLFTFQNSIMPHLFPILF